MKNYFSAHKIRIVILIVALVLALGAVYFYLQYQNAKNLLQNPNQQAAQEAKVIIAQVGKLIELPTSENPTVATVSDKTKLADQPFFAKAENGDKVLIYAQASKAILYRPSINKIIEVSAVNVGQSQQSLLISPAAGISPTVSPTEAPKNINIAIYNGTTTAGLTVKVETSLKAKVPNIKVVARGNAVENYDKTIVVDVSGTNKDSANKIATALGAKVQASLPANEVTPAGADIIILLGTDSSQ